MHLLSLTMKTFTLTAVLFFSATFLLGSTAAFSYQDAKSQTAPPLPTNSDISAEELAAIQKLESKLIEKPRQLTFEGKRAGEGYFSADGSKLVFQSERDLSNPFFQIYLMDRETGDVEKISPGHGKTTCAWIHPDNNRILFGSTQFDPEALAKQKAELEFRASGQQKRYSWDYDENYDLVEFNRSSGEYKKLTHEVGYDAEASYSPDGTKIVFASNRRAYQKGMSDREKELFAIDPASAIDLYLMNVDGSDVRRLTDSIGYDGGPFFSPDGSRICWRRFNEDGATAEIYTMSTDGSDVKRLTSLSAMSWAPYFHPSGKYLIFATNLHGFANFELYLVDTAGKQQPVRVTHTEGFDGLPVFSPDGNTLVWTTNRGSNKQSQLFTATWNHAAALDMLGLKATNDPIVDTREAVSAANDAVTRSAANYSASDIGRHVDYLCRPELGGRLTGTEGEIQATAYVAAYLESLGLRPGGKDNTWFASFPFTAGIDLGEANRMQVGEQTFELNKQWRPLSFSKTGEFPASDVVFAGYGIVAPAVDGYDEYDSYVHLDVENKWVVVFRNMPQDITPEKRQHFARFSSLRFKAMAARDRGALGLIVVSGPTSGVREQLARLELDGALSGTSLAVISVTDDVVEPWFKANDAELAKTQKEFDSGEPAMGFPLEGIKLSANVDVRQIKKQGRNVVGWLRAGEKPTAEAIVIGAHIDHLGKGEGGSSLANENERGGTHRGADDNASGIAAMLEIAQHLADQVRRGELKLKRDIMFAAWSGEELGLIGSSYFADEFYDLYPHYVTPTSPETKEADANAPHSDNKSLYPALVAAFNLDMVGRLRDNLVLQGIGSSSVWTAEIERRNAVVGLPLTLQNDTFLPTDASTFYLRGVPILSAFTGSHSEYHTPRDVPETLNYEGAAKVARLMGLISRSLATMEKAPDFIRVEAPKDGARARLLAYLGSIPDYAKADIKGVLLSGVAKNGPAEKGGIRGGDIITELAGRKIENIYDYTFAIEALKVGQEVEVAVNRKGEALKFKVTPTSRE
jgi:Tol biopolymer transport system component